MGELEQVRNKSNQKIPLKFTKDSAYVSFEFALRAAVFVATKFRPDILQLNQLSFRLNMDGTLMGNKHVVAISVNCVDGGPSCHTAKKLVPVGYQSEPFFGDLFEFSDYVMDTLHMRLGIFDIILKDIFAEASRTGEYEPVHTKKLEEKLEILNKHSIATIGKRFFFKLETENNVKTIVPCGRFSGHLQQSFFVDSFPYEKIIENETISKNAKNLVEKFKFMIQLIKTKKSKRTSALADVAKSFVKDFRQSGLRTGCTPYMHLIGNHLAEQDENENSTAYDMQGVEKSNDLLSRLYFSSSNRAKKPLRTMMQSLYRRLEINFTDPNERVEMARYALNGTFDEVDSDEDENVTDSVLNHSIELNKSNECSTDDSDIDESVIETDDENLDQAPAYVTQSYSRMNRSARDESTTLLEKSLRVMFFRCRIKTYTFGIHSKFIPERDIHLKLSHLENIFQNNLHPLSERHIAGVGETGLDETSKSPLDYQKLAFERQVLLARNLNLPLILHCRGYSHFNTMLDCMESILPVPHHV
ncbi:unnamed protein product [Rotaria socialis]|uniref:Uncharacterized protein n=1 Tax=Rotaria socialis TaxID=392032 RepID=A0A817ZYA2_9BILA|nr:unnamed protein product [Rotaria socialis]CAF4426201.1 unnamed protein product [Rotaria socialis]CAF4491685.1 unnamed protein product [Rotaria socialis]CAF4754245.1 unnamed protein product [Rotaria socialis]